MTLTLASASPRRRELLALLGVAFDVLATDGEERDLPLPVALQAALPACPVALAHHPTALAYKKIIAACAEVSEGVIIGADTIVVLDGQVLNKPRDAADARRMLAALSGAQHTVYTGLGVLLRSPRAGAAAPADAVVLPQGHLLLDLVAARVQIAALSEHEVAAYVATGEPLDKAGAYGIQGLGGRLVERVEGSYTAVVGLPLPAIADLLRRAGVVGLADAAAAYRGWLRAQGKEPLPCPPTLP
jgi:septum formation protein